MISIILKDNYNKKYEIFMHLRDETELNISDNIIKYNEKYPDEFINIETITSRDDIKGTQIEFWEEDQGLYDRIIIKYNNDISNLNLLTRWK